MDSDITSPDEKIEVYDTGYKAFEPGLICKGKQYAENTIFEESGGEICGPGVMHYCSDNPFDVLDYYPLVNERGEISDFAEVESLEMPSKRGNKCSASKIKIGTRLGLKGFVDACIEFIFEKTIKDMPEANINSGDSAQIGSSGDSARIGSSGDSARIGSSGDSAQIGSSGDSARIGSSGDSAQIGSSGDSAQIGSSGDSAQIGSSGYSAQIGSSGDSAQIGSSGDSARIGSSGYYARIGSSGDSARIGSSGNSARINVSGADGVCAAVGIGSSIKSTLGNWITLAEWEYDDTKCRYIPKCVKSAFVDGETIKADVTYMLKDGEFTEVSA